MTTPTAKIVQGNDVVLRFFATDEDDNIPNITGAAIEWSMRPLDDPDAAATLEKSVGSGVTIIDGPGAEFTVTLTKEDMEIDGACGDFVHEPVITFAGGNVITVTDDDGEPFLLTIRKKITSA